MRSWGATGILEGQLYRWSTQGVTTMGHACAVFAKRVAADEHRDINVAKDATMNVFFV